MNIRISSLTAGYGGRNVIEDVSLTFNANEITGLIGPNGSGKSTLLKCIYRILKPRSGSIYLGRQDLSTMSYKESACYTSVLTQNRDSEFDFSVRQIVLMGRTPYKGILEADNMQDHAIAENSMVKTGVIDFADVSYLSLSGGEQQRVMLARVLAQETPCLLLDEPTNHLDITYQLQVMDVVKKEANTVVAAIHDLNIASMYCDKIIALDSGKIVAQGSPKEVLTEKLIYDLYHVKAKIIPCADGRPAVIYERGTV